MDSSTMLLAAFYVVVALVGFDEEKRKITKGPVHRMIDNRSWKTFGLWMAWPIWGAVTLFKCKFKKKKGK